MPTPYPKGSIIVKESDRRKVIEELGDLRFLSSLIGIAGWDANSKIWVTTEQQLERYGWKVEGEKLEPRAGDYLAFVHLFPQGARVVNEEFYDNDYHHMLLEAGRICPTPEQAQAKCDAINSILKGE